MDRLTIKEIDDAIVHLDFSSVSCKDSSRSVIVWAPNGTGKSSIVRALREIGSRSIQIADCEENKLEFVKMNKKLSIALNLNRLADLENDKNVAASSINAKKRLKDLGITSKAIVSQVFPGQAWSPSANEDIIPKFRKDAAIALSERLSVKDLRFYAHHRKELIEIRSLKDAAGQLKDRFISDAIDLLSKGVAEDDRICPICHARLETTLKEVLRQRKNELSKMESGLLVEYGRQRPDLSADQVATQLEEMTMVGATDEELVSLCLLESIQDADKTDEYVRVYCKANEEINRLRREADDYYANLRDSVESVERVFKGVFSAESVELNEDEKSLEIVLPRPVNEYSSGEINLMLTTVRIHAFLASDKSTLVFDDPLSSLDKANQYNTMFQFVRAARERERQLVIFTHNMDCISIANNQAPGSFDYFVMERLGKKMVINSIPIDFFSKSAVDSAFLDGAYADGSLCAGSIVTYAKARIKEQGSAEQITDEGYVIDYVVNSAERESRESDAHSLHEVYHYRFSHTDLDTGLSNDTLVKDIDEFEYLFLDQEDFITRSVQKIYLLTALRVWIEKEIYRYCPELDKSNPLPIGRLIREAMKQWKGPKTVTREYLNSLKVMLNHNAHYGAQAAPFDYAVNLSSDELCRKILEVKAVFGQ
ncbi:hypothetical protein E4J93_03265 [Collinsella sp. BA40]|uniref:hypothetical protein n=1 Tax=Collinsella sp. BA40 TaxID=2560852 RepID=UPI0011CAABA1|nr:hypothetical protein [Collinsella sp. BA40]TXF37554.1 hypothetical protein E4J93_03265 [Collinsella sp. BA40]